MMYFSAASEMNHGAGIVCALKAELCAKSGATLTGGNVCLLHLNCNTEVDFGAVSGAINTFLLFDNDAGHTAGGMDTVMDFRTWDTGYLFKITPANCPGMTDIGTQEGAECVGHIKIRWNNADAYINVFSDNS